MKLAIIGTYGHSYMMLEHLAASTELTLAGAARFGSDDPLGFIGKHPAAPAGLPVYDDYRKLLDEVRPDVVAVFMPLYRNAEVSIAAAQHGCHVLSEKPLATTLEDLQRLAQAVRQNNVQLAALHSMRAEPPYLVAREAVAAGRIGQPVLASGQKSYPFANRDDYYKTRQTYGGSIPWQAIHALDFISYCTGKDYAKVSAMQSNALHAQTHPGMEDNGGLLLELAGGGHAVICFDFLRPWSAGVKRNWGDDRLRLVGSEGVVEVRDGQVTLLSPTAEETLPLPPARDFIGEFVASLQGRGQAMISTAESLRLSEVALRARQAADEQRIVTL